MLFLLPEAQALKTSASALRLEDRKSGNLLLGAQAAVIEPGEVYHTVLLAWGRLDVFGTADEVLVLSGHVVFHPGAKLGKSLVVMGGSYETLPGSAVTNENVVFRAPGPWWRAFQAAVNLWRENFRGVVFFAASFFFLIFFWACTYLLFRAFPGLRQALVLPFWRDWPKNLLAGGIGALVVPVLLSLLIISIFGIVLLPFYLLALALASVVAYAAAVVWAGHRILPARRPGEVRGWSVLIGIVAFHVLWWAGIWWATLPVLFLWMIGWGALLRSLRALWR
jgi:hypothetical protein